MLGPTTDEVAATVVDFSNGKYEISYVPPVAGDYTVSVMLDENAFDADDSYSHIRGSPFQVMCTESWQEVAGVSGTAPGARDHLRLWSKGGKLYVASEDKVEGEEEEEEEEETGGDSDDDCDGIDANLPPEEKLLHYSYNAIKVVPTDFLGDFGAAEPFMIDGDALIAKALNDNLLDTTCGGQMLHVVWTVENILQDLRQRGAHFELFFFEGNLGLWHKMGARARAARAVVMRHFQCANKKREVQGMQPAVVINVLPGGWWSGGPEFRAMVDKVGPEIGRASCRERV